MRKQSEFEDIGALIEDFQLRAILRNPQSSLGKSLVIDDSSLDGTPEANPAYWRGRLQIELPMLRLLLECKGELSPAEYNKVVIRIAELERI